MSFEISRLDDMPAEMLEHMISYCSVEEAEELCKALDAHALLYAYLCPQGFSGREKKHRINTTLMFLQKKDIRCDELKELCMRIEEVVEKSSIFYRERYLSAADVAQKQVDRGGDDLRIPQIFKNDREFILGLLIFDDNLERRKEILSQAHPSLQQDADLVELAFGRRGLLEEERLLKGIRNNEVSFPRLDFMHRNNKAIACAAIYHDPRNYRYCSDAIKNDKSVVMLALKLNRHVYNFLPESLKKDEEIIIAALSPEGRFLYGVKDVWDKIPDEKKKIKKVALAAVQVDPSIYLGMSKEIQEDKAIALEAVKRDGNIYEYLALELRKDRNIAQAALLSKGVHKAYFFFSEDLKQDRELAILAAKKEPLALGHMCEGFRDDPEIVLHSVRAEGESIQFASQRLKGNRRIALEAVKQRPSCIRFLNPSQFSLDELKFLTLTAISRDPMAFIYAKDEIKKDQEVVLATLKKSPDLIKYVPSEVRDSKEFWEKLVLQAPKSFQYAPEAIKDDTRVVYRIMQTCPSLYEFISERLKQDTYVKQLAGLETDLSDEVAHPLSCAVM